MVRFDYVIKNLAPIAFSDKSNDSVLYSTSKHLPGSSVRGALASMYIEERGLKDAHLDEDFYQLFLSGAVRFLPAYPLGNVSKDGSIVFVLPLSLTRSKDGTKISDLAAGEKAQAGYKKVSGYAVESQNNIYTVSAKVYTEFHMSRKEDSERITGSSQKGNVFNYEYLAPGQLFKGSVIADEVVADKVKKLLEENEIIHLGRSKNVQYGKCELEICAGYRNSFSFNPDKKLYMLALTPYIPYDSFQDISEVFAELENEVISSLKDKGVDMKPLTAERNIFADTEEINGFVGVWHLKRARKQAVTAGSLFEINAEGLDSAAVNRIEDLLQQGFGDRTEDGYGQFRLWQPMGLTKDPAELDLNSGIFLSFETDFLFKDNFKFAKDLPKYYAKLLKAKAPKDISFSADDFKVVADGKPLDFNYKKLKAKKIQAGTELLLNTVGWNREKLLRLADLLEVCKGEQPDDGNIYGKTCLYQTRALRANPQAEIVSEYKGSVTDKAVEVLHNKILLELRKDAVQYVEKLVDNKEKSGNNIFRRLLVLMDSNMTRQAILKEINNNFKKQARENLMKVRFKNNSNLLEQLNSNQQVYSGCDWPVKIGLNEQDTENLKNDLGSNIFDISEDVLFKEFWLWFIRHQLKTKDNSKAEGKNTGKEQ